MLITLWLPYCYGNCQSEGHLITRELTLILCLAFDRLHHVVNSTGTAPLVLFLVPNKTPSMVTLEAGPLQASSHVWAVA